MRWLVWNVEVFRKRKPILHIFLETGESLKYNSMFFLIPNFSSLNLWFSSVVFYGSQNLYYFNFVRTAYNTITMLNVIKPVNTVFICFINFRSNSLAIALSRIQWRHRPAIPRRVEPEGQNVFLYFATLEIYSFLHTKLLSYFCTRNCYLLSRIQRRRR